MGCLSHETVTFGRRAAVALCAGALALAGCISAPPERETSSWTIDWRMTPEEFRAIQSKLPPIKEADRLPALRLSQVVVRAPYNTPRFVVMRSDGSYAFDNYNVFAAQPAALIRGAAVDALEASGCVKKVVSTTSSASSPHMLELTVTKLALDCRKEGQRDAVVEVSMALVNDSQIEGVARAMAVAPTKGGDYSAAFSQALAEAMIRAGATMRTGTQQ